VRAARANKRAAQGNVMGRLMAEYASREMDDALQCLTQHGHYLGGGMPIKDVPVGDDTRRALRDVGRRLHWFIRQADLLRREKIITKALFEAAVVETSAFRLWRDVW
jgi:hypothetical protein